MKTLAAGAAAAALAIAVIGGGEAHGAGGQPGIAPAVAQQIATARADQLIEVEVILDQQADLSGLKHSGGRHARLEHVVRALHTFADARQKGLLQLLKLRKGVGSAGKIVPLWIVNGIDVQATPALINELARRPEVAEIRPAASIQAPVAPTTSAAPTGPAQSNLSLVNAPSVWALGDTGAGVVVANMDTGVDVTQPDLAASYRGGADSWYDPNGQHTSTPTDVSGHGTWTMGVMAGGSASGTAVGMAPGAKWIAVKLFNDQGTTTTPIAHQAFQWLLDPDGNPATPDAPDVVLNSWTLGNPGCNLEFEPDIQALRTAGIVPVFAGGNFGPGSGTDASPANNPGAVAVGSTDLTDTLDPGSSRGPSTCDGSTWPQLVAPGVDITTTDLYGGYTVQSGTSLAAPHVAGALALLLSAFPDVSADLQTSALAAGAVDLGVPGPDNDFGAGRLDVLGSYNWLNVQPDFAVSASPSSVTAAAGTTAAFDVAVASRNGFAGDVTLSLSGLTAAQGSWSFEPAIIPGASGSSGLTVITPAGLAPGAYPLTITGTSGNTSHSAAVTLVVPAPPDFTLAGSPASVSTFPGGTVTYSLAVGSASGFAGDVSLSLGGLSGAQASWTFAPATVAGGSGTAQLSVTAAAGLAPATYALTVTGTSGSLSHTASLSLVVKAPPDFTLTATPATASTQAGGLATFTVSIGAKNGFASAVSFTLSGLTTGQATWSFAPPTVTKSGTTALKVTTAASLAPGSYALAIKGVSGSLSHTASVTLVVAVPPDFSIALGPASVTVTAGSNATYTVSIGATGGFSGNVSLAATGLPSGATATFSTSPVAAPGSSTLTVRTTRTTAKGTFTIRVTGSSGTLSHPATATLVVR
ncbi:MAG TPA: S8 family serine peptidase [Gaiellaceae bacterium]|nr:S8 family serine peptidase [Gaiellaceae bacterium]